jgi:hypothetical protein
MFKSFGDVEYHDSGWIVLACCQDLTRYYKSWLRVKALCSAPYGSHITIVNGREEDPRASDAWKKYNGKTIEFGYEPDIRTDGEYYWLPVVCPQLLDLREELGLKRELRFPLHLTVAKVKDNVK